MLRLRRIFNPHLRQRGVERQLARHARRICIEHMRGDAAVLERIPDEMRFRKVRGGVDALQKRYDTMAPQASCLMPERPEMLRYERLRPTRGVTRPVMPSDVVM